MTEAEFYGCCWDILVEHAGAARHHRERERFVFACLETKNTLEFRFCGVLGFGGKLWRYDGKVYVSCYPEDETPERRQVIDKVNTLLGELATPRAAE